MTSKADDVPEDSKPQLVLSVPPIIRAMSIGFGVFNILIGYGLFIFKGTVGLIIANSVITTKIWAGIFLLVGILTLYAIHAKKHKFLRLMMLCGVFVKTAWLIALSIRISIGGSFFITVLWGFLTFIQLVVYIYFFAENNSYPV